MYAEIKSTNKILINRLDENEKVLFESILDCSDGKEIKLEKIYGEDGEFAGCFILLEDKEIVEEPVEDVE